MKILCILSDENFSAYLVSGLKADHFIVDTVHSPAKGICLIESRDYDLIIIEDFKGLINGAQLAVEIREYKKSIPLIGLIHDNNLERRVDLLLAGFDEILPINTALLEITTRMHRLILRNSSYSHSSILKYDDLEMDINRRIVKRGTTQIILRKKEYEVLEYMLHYPEQVLSRQRLLQHVWPEDVFMYTNTVDVHIASLRNKIDCESTNRIIQTVHGIGYKISCQDN